MMRRNEESKVLSNEEAARIIIKDPVKYPGLMQLWAQMVLEQGED